MAQIKNIMYVASEKLSDYIAKNYPETDELGYITFPESQIGEVIYNSYRIGILKGTEKKLKYVRHQSECRAFLLGEFLLPKGEKPDDFFFQEKIYVSGDIESGYNQGASIYLSPKGKIEYLSDKGPVQHSVGYDTVKGVVGGN